MVVAEMSRAVQVNNNSTLTNKSRLPNGVVVDFRGINLKLYIYTLCRGRQNQGVKKG